MTGLCPYLLTIGLDLSTATAEELKEGKKTVQEKVLAALMLDGANGTMYNDLKRSTKENFVMGTSTYPGSSEAVLCILNAYQPPAGWGKRRQDTGTGIKEGTIFAQTEGDNSWKTRVNCHNCGKKVSDLWYKAKVSLGAKRFPAKKCLP